MTTTPGPAWVVLGALILMGCPNRLEPVEQDDTTGEFATGSSSSSTDVVAGSSTSSGGDSSSGMSSSGEDPCTPDPCSNGASCNAGSCVCPPGFEGELCETNIDDCADFSCKNGGTCIDGVDEATCECLPGFEGVICQVNIDDCEGVECLNDGACIDGVEEFDCLCQYGYGGQFCECGFEHVVFGFAETVTPMLVDAPSGLTITGSNDLYMIYNALGIQGGPYDTLVDPGEWVSFAFDTPAEWIVLGYASWFDTDSNGVSGEGAVEAFGSDGRLLGLLPVPEGHGHNLYVTDIFDGAPISRFTLHSTADAFRLEGVHWVPASCSE